MIVRKILDDELLRGYMHRVRSENVIPSCEDLLRRLSKKDRFSGKTTADQVDLTESLLKVLGMEAAVLVRRHSLVPFIRCVASRGQPPIEWGGLCTRRQLLEAAWGSKRALFCRKCVQDDIDTHGTSFWHRTHQLPGHVWCLKHECSLSQSESSPPFSESPRYLLDDSVDLPADEVCEAMSSAAVRRYMQISTLLLNESSIQIAPGSAAKAIRDAAARKGLRIGGSGRSIKSVRYISDEAAEVLPARWLRTHFQKSAQKSCGKFAAWIDQTGHTRQRPVAAATFALALALLWENPSAAVSDFRGTRHIPSAIRRMRVSWPQVDFSTLWLENKGQFPKISKELGMPRRLIQDRYKSFGCRGMRTGEFERAQQALSKFQRGHGMAEAASMANVELASVETLVRVLVLKSTNDKQLEVAA